MLQRVDSGCVQLRKDLAEAAGHEAEIGERGRGGGGSGGE
jgi:hypothetical protein